MLQVCNKLLQKRIKFFKLEAIVQGISVIDKGNSSILLKVHNKLLRNASSLQQIVAEKDKIL